MLGAPPFSPPLPHNHILHHMCVQFIYLLAASEDQGSTYVLALNASGACVATFHIYAYVTQFVGPTLLVDPDGVTVYVPVDYSCANYLCPLVIQVRA